MKESKSNILPVDGEVFLYENVFNVSEQEALLKYLLKEVAWRQQEIRIFGRWVAMPRLTAWYGDEGISYTYSGLANKALSWTKELLLIKAKAEQVAGTSFNSVLLNNYRNGRDSMGWHKDDEKELGISPIIASVSFGAERNFQLKHGKEKHLKIQLTLKSGSLLLMKGETQKYWYHGVPKTKMEVGARVNLTFRQIHPL